MRPAESLVWAVVGASGAWLAVSTVIPMALRVLVVIGQRVQPLSRPVAALVAVVLLAAAMRPSPSAAVVPPPAERVIVESQPASAGAAIRNPVTERVAGGTAVLAHTVVDGDTLWGIARNALDRRGAQATGAEIVTLWKAIYRANIAVIGPDPDLILPGQVLAIPGGIHG